MQERPEGRSYIAANQGERVGRRGRSLLVFLGSTVLLSQVQPISMTDGMSISNGKSVLKLDVGMVVEALEMLEPELQGSPNPAGRSLIWSATVSVSCDMFLGRVCPDPLNSRS